MKKRLLSIIMVSAMALQVVACGAADVASAEGVEVEAVTDAEAGAAEAALAEFEAANGTQEIVETETPLTADATQSQTYDFEGQYYVGKGNLSITQQESGDFLIEVWWGDSAATHGEWVMHGKFDGVDTITYSDCEKHEYTLKDNGEVDTDETVYTNGTGSIKIVDANTIMWNDDMEHIADEVQMTR